MSLIGLGKYFEFKMIDYCADGMKFVSQTAVNIAEHYIFAIPNTKGGVVKVKGRIAWAQHVEVAEGEGKKSAWMAGVKFDPMSEGAQVQLEAVMKAFLRKDMTVRKARVKRHYGKGGGD